VQAYSIQASLSTTALAAKLQYWQALCHLMITAVCYRRWHDFQEDSNPFAQFLRSRSISLSTYVQYYFAQSLIDLKVTTRFPAFIAQFENNIFAT
jgi:hypothetical protein